jgi:hypothetical protein
MVASDPHSAIPRVAVKEARRGIDRNLVVIGLEAVALRVAR